jgi:hypothetical protein
MSQLDVLSTAAGLGTFEASTVAAYCPEDESTVRSVLREHQGRLFTRREPSHAEEPAVSRWRVKDAEELRRLIASCAPPPAEPQTVPLATPAEAMIPLRMSLAERLLAGGVSMEPKPREQRISVALKYLHQCHPWPRGAQDNRPLGPDYLSSAPSRLRFDLALGEMMMSEITQAPVEPWVLLAALDNADALAAAGHPERAERLFGWLAAFAEERLSRIALPAVEVTLEPRGELAFAGADGQVPQAFPRIARLLREALGQGTIDESPDNSRQQRRPGAASAERPQWTDRTDRAVSTPMPVEGHPAVATPAIGYLADGKPRHRAVPGSEGEPASLRTSGWKGLSRSLAALRRPSVPRRARS